MKIWLKNNRQMLLRGAGTVLAIVLLVVLLYQSGWEDVSAALKRISFWNLALAFGCIVLSRLCITARWYVLLRSGGVKIPFKDAASLVFTGLFANNFLPTTIGGVSHEYTAVVFRVDGTTGRLTPTGAPVTVPNPFCERFLPVR